MKPDYDAKLRELGIELYVVGEPRTGYTKAVQTGNLVYLAGHGPFEDNVQRYKGKVGVDLTPQEGREAARFTTIGCLSTLSKHLGGSLNRVKRIVRVTSYVNAAPNCDEYFWATDGCSDLLKELFGPTGHHARMSIGCSVIPRQVPVAIDMIVEVEPDPNEQKKTVTEMPDYDARLKELGVELYPVKTPRTGYTPAVQTGNLVYLSGHGPFRDDGPDKPRFQAYTGKVGVDMTPQEAQACSRFSCIGILSTLRDHLGGSLNRVRRIVRVTSYVNAAPDCDLYFFSSDGASDLLKQIFGEAGHHARMSIGTSVNPTQVPVALDMIVEVAPE